MSTLDLLSFARNGFSRISQSFQSSLRFTVKNTAEKHDWLWEFLFSVKDRMFRFPSMYERVLYKKNLGSVEQITVTGYYIVHYNHLMFFLQISLHKPAIQLSISGFHLIFLDQNRESSKYAS